MRQRGAVGVMEGGDVIFGRTTVDDCFELRKVNAMVWRAKRESVTGSGCSYVAKTTFDEVELRRSYR